MQRRLKCCLCVQINFYASDCLFVQKSHGIGGNTSWQDFHFTTSLSCWTLFTVPFPIPWWWTVIPKAGAACWTSHTSPLPCKAVTISCREWAWCQCNWKILVTQVLSVFYILWCSSWHSRGNWHLCSSRVLDVAQHTVIAFLRGLWSFKWIVLSVANDRM